MQSYSSRSAAAARSSDGLCMGSLLYSASAKTIICRPTTSVAKAQTASCRVFDVCSRALFKETAFGFENPLTAASHVANCRCDENLKKTFDKFWAVKLALSARPLGFLAPPAAVDFRRDAAIHPVQVRGPLALRSSGCRSQASPPCPCWTGNLLDRCPRAPHACAS